MIRVKLSSLRSKTAATAVVLMLTAFIGGWLAQTSLGGGDYYYEVKRGLRLFGDVYKNITEKYVDEITPHDFIRSGIDGLLSKLDPYTVYYEGDESSDLDALMMGKYGGIGLSIGIKGGYITVISASDGSPGQRAGILPGDRIIAVDGHSTKDWKYQEMSNYVKGEPGSKIKLTILREGEPSPIDFELIREMIAVENIAYFGLSQEQIGYIKLTKFSKTADVDMVQALKELKRQGMKGLIIDLRGNPGGLLDAAIDITNQFVKKGETITFTKGRSNDANRYYTASNDPMLPDIPLAVLVDGGTASAAEIVAGALQDLDRAVIVGSTTFGKGLVQTLYPLTEKNAVMKITTAKYFTPSGRCIQKEDYTAKYRRTLSSVRDEEEYDTFGVDEMVEDSLHEDEKPLLPYKTKTGRAVFANGGITPDVVIPSREFTAFFTEILKKGMIFDFATHFVAQHKKIDSTFTADEQLMQDFKRYLAEKKFSYVPAVEKELNDLVDISKKSDYDQAFMLKLDDLGQSVKQVKDKDFDRNYDLIKRGLELEIISRYYGHKAGAMAVSRYDLQYQEAVKILRDADGYKKILTKR